MAPDDKDNSKETASKEKDYSAKIYKVKHMTKKEWKAYKEKQKNKMNSDDKAKANKAAKKLKQLKEARKAKKEKKQIKLKTKLDYLKAGIKAYNDLSHQEKKLANRNTQFLKPFNGYGLKDYIKDTQRFANPKATNNMSEYMFRYNNIVAEAIKKQTEKMTQFKQDQEEYFKQQKARHDQMLHNNAIARTNEFNERININGHVMTEDSYVLKELRDKQIRKMEENLELDAKIYADRLNRRDMNRHLIQIEMDKIVNGKHDIGPFRDSIIKGTSNDFREIVDGENITVLSHPDYVNLKKQEQIDYFNKLSTILKAATKYGVFAAQTILSLGGVPTIVDTVKRIFSDNKITEGVDVEYLD